MKKVCFSIAAFVLCLATSQLVGQCWDFNIITGLPGFAGNCNDNGTICDDTDDFYVIEFTAADGTPNASNAYNLVFNGVPYGPFNYILPVIPYSYHNLGQFPADGSLFTYTITDVDDPTCTYTYIHIFTADPCSPGITTSSIIYICNDNGTPFDPTDDYYDVSLNASGGTGQYEVNDGVNKYGPFSYDVTNTFQIDADGLIHTLQIVDLGDPSCNLEEIIGPLVPCSEECEIIIDDVTLICHDNNTPDPNDDYYTITVTASQTFLRPDFVAIIGGRQFGPFAFNVPNSFDHPADGGSYILKIGDSQYPDLCFDEVPIGPLAPCSLPCELEAEIIEIKCIHNETADPSDDFYEILVSVTSLNAGLSDTYIIDIDGVDYGPYNYGNSYLLSLDADGAIHLLKIHDALYPTFCKDEISTPILEPCSPSCDLQFSNLIWTCFDNGTPDPLDDYYLVEINVIEEYAGLNYRVLMNALDYGPFEYMVDTSFRVPADNGKYLLTIEDVIYPNICTISDSIGPLIPCSSTCDLEVEIINVRCDNNKTGKDSTDDFFTFDILVEASNAGDFWRAYEVDTVSGSYGDTLTMGPFLISNGDVTINAEDTMDVFCRQTINVSAPLHCSDSCWIANVVYTTDSCYDNGTGQDTTDDVFYISLEVNGTNTGANKSYMVNWIGGTLGPFDYDVLNVIPGLPSNGSNIILTITDSDLAYCEYVLDLTNPHCSSCNQTVDAGPSKLITCIDKEVILEGSASESGQYSWSGPNNSMFTGSNPIVDVGGWYLLSVTFMNGCIIEDSVWVDEDNMIPVAKAGPDGVITCKDEEYTLTGSTSNPGSNFVFQWTDDQGNVISNMASHTVNVPGIYCLVVIDTIQNCISSEDCVEVTENKTPPDAFIFVGPQSSLNCFVDSVNLFTSSQPNVVYQWQIKSSQVSSPSIWVRDTGKVILIAIDTSNGCRSVADTTIESRIEYPLVEILPPDTLNCIVAEILLDASASQKGPQLKYQWLDQAFTPIPGAINLTWQVSRPGTYYFASLDSIIGCENIDTVVVEALFNYPQVLAMSNQLLDCLSDTLRLSANVNTTTVVINWVAQNGGTVVAGSNGLNPLINGEGLYIIEVQDLESGCITKDSVEVNRAESPEEIMLSVMDPLCYGDSSGTIKLDNINGGSPPYDIYFEGNLSSATEWFNLGPGNYSIEIVDLYGCDIDTVIEIIETDELDLSIDGITEIKAGQTTTLTGLTNILLSDISTILWRSSGEIMCPDCIDIDVSPDTTTTYILQIIDKNGCVAIAEITVVVIKESKVFIPNIISPNGDGLNDVLRVFGNDVVWINQMAIFDRWGELIYKGEGTPDETVWDGTFDGTILKPDVFVYYVELETNLGLVQQFSGSVTVVR